MRVFVENDAPKIIMELYDNSIFINVSVETSECDQHDADCTSHGDRASIFSGKLHCNNG
jgi:hypothetical protein